MAEMAGDREAADAPRKRLGAVGVRLSRCVLSSLVRAQCSSTQYNCDFFFYYSIILFHRKADKGALLYERAIKVVLKVKLKPFLKNLLACFVCLPFNTFLLEIYYFSKV